MEYNLSDVTVNEQEFLRMTAEVAAAYVGNNHAQVEDLPHLITVVHNALRDLVVNGSKAEPQAPLEPAVPIKKSIQPDHLVCLEDGKKLKMLKRHLRTVYNLSPEEYRAKWGLPSDYPMVAPNYAAMRSDFAKKIGLGRNRAAE
jgi:predicted transcriptional regulator